MTALRRYQWNHHLRNRSLQELLLNNVKSSFFTPVSSYKLISHKGKNNLLHLKIKTFNILKMEFLFTCKSSAIIIDIKCYAFFLHLKYQQGHSSHYYTTWWILSIGFPRNLPESVLQKLVSALGRVQQKACGLRCIIF